MIRVGPDQPIAGDDPWFIGAGTPLIPAFLSLLDEIFTTIRFQLSAECVPISS